MDNVKLLDLLINKIFFYIKKSKINTTEHSHNIEIYSDKVVNIRGADGGIVAYYVNGLHKCL